jgi:hypothetical protein
MRTNNCKTIRLEIEEAGLEEQLVKPTLSHLRDCEECRSFHDSRLKLRQIVASLETIEAPADFDFRLRARLAREDSRASRRFAMGGFSFGLRSLVLPTLLLLMGAGFVWRILRPDANNSALVVVEKPKIDIADSRLPNEASRVDNPGPMATLRASKRGYTLRPRKSAGKAVNASGRTMAANLRHNGRMVTREFSVLPALVIKRQDSVASVDPLSVFPISASSQSLKVSLDDGSGVLRTISLPTVSFGPQRVLNQDGFLVVKASARGVW